MSREDDALADDARALLSAYRAEEGLPADVRARVWSRVDRSMQVDAEPRVTTSRSHARWAVIGLAVAAAIAAMWWGRARLSESPSDASPSAASLDRDDAREADTATTRDTTPARPTPATLPASPAVAADPPAAADPPTDRAPRPAARPSSRAATEVDALADEMELVRAAQSALARDDAAHALALLDAGKRRFGAGTLAEEREALHVLALCDAGKRDKAHDEAAAFAAAHPRSPLLSRVRAACSDDPP